MLIQGSVRTYTGNLHRRKYSYVSTVMEVSEAFSRTFSSESLKNLIKLIPPVMSNETLPFQNKPQPRLHRATTRPREWTTQNIRAIDVKTTQVHFTNDTTLT